MFFVFCTSWKSLNFVNFIHVTAQWVYACTPQADRIFCICCPNVPWIEASWHQFQRDGNQKPSPSIGKERHRHLLESAFRSSVGWSFQSAASGASSNADALGIATAQDCMCSGLYHLRLNLPSFQSVFFDTKIMATKRSHAQTFLYLERLSHFVTQCLCTFCVSAAPSSKVPDPARAIAMRPRFAVDEPRSSHVLQRSTYQLRPFGSCTTNATAKKVLARMLFPLLDAYPCTPKLLDI